jgi:hypothetical protein
LQGGSRYVLKFSKNELPPVNAFWSLTLLDDEGRMVDNMLNRYALRGDRLKTNGDGSVTISIQAPPPGADRATNWLPAPKATSNSCCVSTGPKTRHQPHLKPRRSSAPTEQEVRASGYFVRLLGDRGTPRSPQ